MTEHSEYIKRVSHKSITYVTTVHEQPRFDPLRAYTNDGRIFRRKRDFASDRFAVLQ